MSKRLSLFQDIQKTKSVNVGQNLLTEIVVSNSFKRNLKMATLSIDLDRLM